VNAQACYACFSCSSVHAQPSLVHIFFPFKPEGCDSRQPCILAMGYRGLRRRLLQGKSVQSEEHFCRVQLPAISLWLELKEPSSHQAMFNGKSQWAV
jgi:hypothetical protein